VEGVLGKGLGCCRYVGGEGKGCGGGSGGKEWGAAGMDCAGMHVRGNGMFSMGGSEACLRL
jgi:hypothetical protein